MRVAAVWSPHAGRRLLCVVQDGELMPVGNGESYPDVSELLARRGRSLEEAVMSAGVSATSLGSYDDLAASGPEDDLMHLVAPVTPPEVWAAGVTYERSREARMEESTESDIYDRIYNAERPEIFLKSTGSRIAGPGAPVGLRSDSEWQVPEPEIGLVLGDHGEIAGYTLGNDMSSRDIEGDNPLYLPQAKIFAGSCAIGPTVIAAPAVEDPYGLEIVMRIERNGADVFEGTTSTARLHLRFDVLTAYLKRDNWLAPGTVLLTGTGIVPPLDFTLQRGDVISISCAPIGTLTNHCLLAKELQPPAGWMS
jgi:2-dehydro-3-deoxy-D-arabinonate dehydratase